MFKLDLKKAEEPEIKFPASIGSSRKQESYRKISTSASLTMLKSLTMWITTNWKILKETGIPDHLTCLLRNLYADQGERVRTRHGTINCFKIVKVQGCILSLCLFNYYAEYIMWNARMDETQAGIKFAEGNINILRYADDATLMAKNEEELKSLLVSVKEESEKVGSNLNIQKTNVMTYSPTLHSK